MTVWPILGDRVKSRDHVRLEKDRDIDHPRLTCLHCGAVRYISYPLLVGVLIEIATEFIEGHQHCLPADHIEFVSDTEACCHGCRQTQYSIQGASIDKALFIAAHIDCKELCSC